ncbi:MAG: hypothetical protein ACF787_06475, partial [Rhodopirellula sp. JB053]
MVVLGLVMLVAGGGCALVPETRTRDALHNPFPQLKRVAVLPFFNQSDQPNVDGEAVGRAYYAALQAVPGFEVLPVGVTTLQYRAFSAQFGEPRSGEDFQKLAQMMDVEAIVVGSVTDFDAYYPPRMGLTVHWYAANEGFHAIPPGYGLPWGTESEDKIPARIAREAEFELARSQLKTQEPRSAPLASMPSVPGVQPGSPSDTPPAADRHPVEHSPTESDPWGEPVAQSQISRTQFTENITEQQIVLPSPGQPAPSPAVLTNGHAAEHAEFEYAETGSLDGIVSGPVYADD